MQVGTSRPILDKPTPDATVDILNYFIRHPGAADSIEGIARWRLMEELAHRKAEETDRAVRWLVERGFLIRHALPGGRSIFALNPEKVEDAQQFVQTRGAQ